jgi:hypothetical protein
LGDGGKILPARGAGEHGAAGHPVDQAAEREQPVLGELILQTGNAFSIGVVVHVLPALSLPAGKKRPRAKTPRSA